MIDREKRMKEAVQFTDKNSCYIHTEMKNGRKCETVLAGDGVAILYGICGEISRVCQISGGTFEQALETIRQIHYTNIKGENS